MSHFCNASNFTDLKFSGNNTDQKSLKFRKDSSFARMTEQIQILHCRLKCFSRDLKVLWIA